LYTSRPHLRRPSGHRNRLAPAGVANRSRQGLRIAELPKWRLRRAFDYIDAHLDEHIGLAEISTAASLTRIHFAARFRVETGLRPYEYLLRRRIERARVLPCKSVPTGRVALPAGFRNEAHFTTVFKRFVGQPPHAWRRSLSER
jgi:AraC family transcriptional regulator